MISERAKQEPGKRGRAEEPVKIPAPRPEGNEAIEKDDKKAEKEEGQG